MRLTACFVVTSLLLLAYPAAAQNGVLLPSDSGTPSPNSFLPAPSTQAPTSPKAKAQTKVDTKTKTSIQPGGTIDKTAAQANTNDLMQALSAKAGNVDPTAGLSAQQKDMLNQLAALSDAARPASAFVDEPEATEDASEYKKYLPVSPYAATILVDPNYIWGAQDIQFITSALGYKAEDVPANCQLRLETRIQSDKGANFSKKIMAGNQDKLDFDGTPSKVSFMPSAVCKPPSAPIPKAGTIIMRVGGMYGLNLVNQFDCSISQDILTSLQSRKGFSMTVKYLGAGKASCS